MIEWPRKVSTMLFSSGGRGSHLTNVIKRKMLHATPVGYLEAEKRGKAINHITGEPTASEVTQS